MKQLNTTLMVNIWVDDKDSDNWDIRWSTELDAAKVIELLKKITEELGGK